MSRRNKTLLTFYKVTAIPTITYGAECWVHTKRSEQNSGVGHDIPENSIRRELRVTSRMSDARLPKLMLFYKSKGKRPLAIGTKQKMD